MHEGFACVTNEESLKKIFSSIENRLPYVLYPLSLTWINFNHSMDK